MSLSNYILLTSKDEYEFYIERIVAEQSNKLKSMINSEYIENKLIKISLPEINGNVLEIIVDYLNEKYYYENLIKDIHKAPEFKIKDTLALDVLKASIFLEC